MQQELKRFGLDAKTEECLRLFFVRAFVYGVVVVARALYNGLYIYMIESVGADCEGGSYPPGCFKLF